MLSSNRRNTRADRTSQSTVRENPAMIGFLYRTCEEKLTAIVSYLHSAVLMENDTTPGAELCRLIATAQIEQYSALCRVLRDLGVPFRLQTCIKLEQCAHRDSRHACTLELLGAHACKEAALAKGYASAASSCATPTTARLLAQLSSTGEEHASLLQGLIARLSRS